jgi:hypothetical protein
VSACVRPISAKVMDVEYMLPTPTGVVALPQGRKIVFTYEGDIHSWLADAEFDPGIPHASLN